jgi:hypothetical protein
LEQTIKLFNAGRGPRKEASSPQFRNWWIFKTKSFKDLQGLKKKKKKTLQAKQRGLLEHFTWEQSKLKNVYLGQGWEQRDTETFDS